MSKKTGLKTLSLILANLTAFGPFITDFYLPCLPELTKYFASTPALVQTSLTAGMWGLAVGQMLIGPLCDKYGRKLPLFWSLLVFAASTAGCMLSTSMTMFIFFRLLQGLTGASGLVISKAIVADSFSGADLAKYFAMLAAVQGAAPIIAPVLGGVAFSFTSWQGTFGLLGLWGLCLYALCRHLQETLPPSERISRSIVGSYACYLDTIRNAPYLVMNLLQGFSSAALLAYIAASPFIFQEHYGLSPLGYGICFACNSLGLVVGSAVVIRMKALSGPLTAGTVGVAAASLLAAWLIWTGYPFASFEAALILMLFCVGMITPLGITMSLNTIRTNRGVASALLGAVPFFLGGIVSPLTGIGNIIHSMSIIMVTCACICLLLRLISLKWNYAPAIAGNATPSK